MIEHIIRKILKEQEEHTINVHYTGEEFWGNQGAGVLPIAKSTGRILVSHRAPYDVQEPDTWGVFGGAIDSGEDPKEAAKREMQEELGYHGSVQLIPAYVFTSQSGEFKYYNFIGLVDEEFEAELDWETQDTRWVTYDEMLSIRPMHFGLKALIQNSESLIQKYTVNDLYEGIVKNILNEMLLCELLKMKGMWDEDGDMYINKGKYVFKVDSESNMDDYVDMFDFLNIGHIGIEKLSELTSNRDLVSTFLVPSNILIVMKTDDDTVSYNTDAGFTDNPGTSVQFKKFFDFLKKNEGIEYLDVKDQIENLSTQEYEDYGRIFYIDNLFEELLSNTLYHGTTTKFIESILRTGINADPNVSTFESVKHSKYSFFTPLKNVAMYYANRSASEHGEIPIILQIDKKGFDKSKIIIDYDLYAQYIQDDSIPEYQKNISDYHKFFRHYTNKKRELNRPEKFDRFGYGGRLYPKHIKKIWYNRDNEQNEFKWGEIEINNKEELTDWFNNLEFQRDNDNMEMSIKNYSFELYDYREEYEEEEEYD